MAESKYRKSNIERRQSTLQNAESRNSPVVGSNKPIKTAGQVYVSPKNHYLWVMFIQDEISGKVNDFIILCKAHNVRYIYAFGSSITKRFDRANSDIDLLVDIDYDDPIEKGDKLISLWDTFEQFFKRRVDLLTETSIHNPYLRKSIDSSKILIYDGAKQKVLV